jgi:hypothetical protein
MRVSISVVKIVIFCWCSGTAIAQLPATEEIGILYRREFGGGGFLATNGLGLHGYYGIQKNYKHRWMFSGEFGNLKHEKETKSFNANYQDARGYFFGKVNSLVYLNASVGGKHLWFESKRIQGVEISGVWSLGLTIGYLKPVYLKIREPYIGGEGYEKPVDKRYDPLVHYQENIYGRSSYFKGFGSGKLQPGLQAKAGIFFNLSKFDERIIGVEVGVKADYFFQPVELMYDYPRKNILGAFYARFVLGAKRA